MKHIFLLCSFLFFFCCSPVAQATDIKLFIEFENAKLKQYKDVYETQDKYIVVWVGIEDFELYKQIRTQYPDYIHVFAKTFPYITKGMVLSKNKQRLKDIQDNYLNSLNPLIKQTVPEPIVPFQQFQFGNNCNTRGR